MSPKRGQLPWEGKGPHAGWGCQCTRRRSGVGPGDAPARASNAGRHPLLQPVSPGSGHRRVKYTHRRKAEHTVLSLSPSVSLTQNRLDSVRSPGKVQKKAYSVFVIL